VETDLTKRDIIELIASLGNCCKHLDINPNFHPTWWEKLLLRYIFERRYLAPPIAYACMEWLKRNKYA